MKKREGCLKVSLIFVLIIAFLVALFIYIPLYSSAIAKARTLSDWQTMRCDIVHFIPGAEDAGTILRCYDSEKDNYCYIMILPFEGISCVPNHINLISGEYVGTP